MFVPCHYLEVYLQRDVGVQPFVICRGFLFSFPFRFSTRFCFSTPFNNIVIDILVDCWCPCLRFIGREEITLLAPFARISLAFSNRFLCFFALIFNTFVLRLVRTSLRSSGEDSSNWEMIWESCFSSPGSIESPQSAPH